LVDYGKRDLLFLERLVRKKDSLEEKLKNKSSKESFNYFMEPGNMRGEYLGACLDNCRLGSMTSVAWETDIRGLMKFIEKWRKENNDDENLYHEIPIDELYNRFELPYINHDECPRDKKHKDTFKDSLGRLRCGHKTIKMIRPSFMVSYNSGTDEFSQMETKEYYEEEPSDPSYEDNEGEIDCPEEMWEKYLLDVEKWEDEKPTEKVVDVCYAILSDKNVIMPFETALERMNLSLRFKTTYWDSSNYLYCRKDSSAVFCQGHKEPSKFIEFPFDGWDMAYYLLRWKQQKEIFGKEPQWFAKKHEFWILKQIPAID